MDKAPDAFRTISEVADDLDIPQHGTAEDARARQEALCVVPYGRYEAMAVSPLASGRLDPPDICLVYATPGQMIILINGLQYTGYKKFEWGVVGETACADSWGRALATGEPSLSLPCFAERRYGGVPDEEMLMALSPTHLAKAIVGMKALAKNEIGIILCIEEIDQFLAVFIGADDDGAPVEAAIARPAADQCTDHQPADDEAHQSDKVKCREPEPRDLAAELESK